jgi:MtrB/PioB family decaheme-associated outer membrane protein
MKSWIISAILIFGIGFFSIAVAEDGKLSGEVSATGTLTSVSGNKAKLKEYLDIQSGVYGNIKLKYDSEKYYTDFNARDMGYNTQHYNVEGGKYGDFKLNINYNEIPHNFTYDARSFYSGIGSSNLTYPTQPPSTNTGIWNTFDYSTKRKSLGAGFKLDAVKPFFFDVSAASEEKTGIYPLGAAGTTAGGIAIELPAPINYRTDSVKLAAGYARNPLYFSLGYFYSNFTSNNLNLNYRNPATANTASATDTSTMAPENRYYKVNLTGGIRLPLNSKLDINLATASAKSNGSLLSSYVANVAGGLTGITLSSPTFNGQVDARNLAMSLTSKPFLSIDTKLFLKYDERQNKSDQITTTVGTSTLINSLFDYRKVKFGVELGFRLPAKFYLNASYSHGTIDRLRDDIPKNRDDRYGAELRWTGLDFMTARVGYERLERWAEFNPTTTTDIRPFDAAGKNMGTYKTSLDFFPTENLNFSLGYKHKETNYQDTIIGLTGDRRDEFSVDADYLIVKRVKLFGFFDYERIQQNQAQRPADRWTAAQKDESYSFSIGTDIFIIPEKLTLRLQHSYLESNGSIDYTYFNLPGGRTQDNIDLSNWDSYQLRYYLVKLTYNATKTLSIATGYAYEKYSYSDAQYDGYRYVPTNTSGTTILAYLTGAYRDPSYESHTGFITFSYRF